MNKNLLRGIIIVTWVLFFLDFSKWNAMWDVLWSALGCLAVYCTGEIREREPATRQPVSAKTAWGAAFLVCGLIAASRTFLPVHVARLIPFLVIIGAFFIWKLLPDCNPEEHPGEHVVSGDTSRKP
jgi:hypothetical protein